MSNNHHVFKMQYPSLTKRSGLVPSTAMEVFGQDNPFCFFQFFSVALISKHK